MKILVINAGSSSLKYQLIDMSNEEVIAKGLCERIAINGSFLTHKANGKEFVFNKDMPGHTVAIRMVLDALVSPECGVIKFRRWGTASSTAPRISAPPSSSTQRFWIP